MTEAAIFQFCGTPNNVHLETHPGVLGPGRVYHSLASSQISRPTYQHPASSNEKLGSLSWAGPVNSSARGPPSSTNPPAAGVWLGSRRPRVSQWSACDSIKATGGIRIPPALFWVLICTQRPTCDAGGTGPKRGTPRAAVTCRARGNIPVGCWSFNARL